MQYVQVLDHKKNPLMPCNPGRARQMLAQGRAAVFRMFPFTIILNRRRWKRRRGRKGFQPITLKIDPGSRTTGLALVVEGKRGKRIVWAADLHHRGQVIRDRLLTRRQLRRGRRSRKTRYRKPRFLNRRRPAGWLPPSLQSRVDNILTWVERLYRFSPIMALAQELVRFDTQKLQNPEISGIEYQQGTLFGYEVREYLLEKWNRTCAYCGAENVPLEIEHINPRDRGGSNRISNLTLACVPCNRKKGNRTAAEFGYPHIQALAKKPFKDAAAVNVTRWALFRALESTGLPLEVGTGGRTKYNRVKQNYPKTHWTDAACVGQSGERVYIAPNHTPLSIKATGRGSRQMCRMDKYGFPRTRAKQFKQVKGFQTGDMVRASVPRGKNKGVHIGRVAVRASGSFRVGKVDGISWKCCAMLQQTDGYEYTKGEALSSAPDKSRQFPSAKNR